MFKRILQGVVLLSAFGLAGCDVDVKDPGELPDVDVETEPGRTPDVDVEGPDVDVDRKDTTVDVPDVDVDVDTEERKVPIPDVDVDVPDDEEKDVDE